MMLDIDSLYRTWKITFFLEPFIILCQCLAIVTWFRYYRNETTRKVFLTYTIISLLLFLYVPFADILQIIKKPSLTWDLSLNALFEVSEYYCFNYFFQKVLHSKKVKLLLSSFTAPILLFAGTAILEAADTHVLSSKAIKYTDLTSCCVFVALIIGSLTFIFEIFKFDTTPTISTRPSIWIVTGALFYSLYSLPFLLISQVVLMTNRQLYVALYSGHYVMFSFIFIMLAKAFSCKRPLTV